MIEEKSNDPTERSRFALQVLRLLIEFADYERGNVPYEFLTTMEGLAAIVKKPDWLLLHDENGRYQTSEEAVEYQKRHMAVRETAIKGHDPSAANENTKKRYCPNCESIILSGKASICLWCGEKITQQSEGDA